MSGITKLVVGSTFAVHPPHAGGQLRIFHLYRELARHCDVDVIALVDRDQAASRRLLAPGLTEIRIPKSPRHDAAEAELRVTEVSVTDTAFVDLHELTPAYGQAVARSWVPGGAMVASHPYAFPAMRAVDQGATWWYDAHNVEADLKAAVLPTTRTGKRLLARTKAVERECSRRAGLVLASSNEDGQRLRALYRLPVAKVRVVPNGVDTSAIRFVAPSQRRALRGRLRLEQPLALFVGSWHEPNVVAAREILRLAAEVPELKFAIVGSVGIPLQQEERPPNVELFGVVAEDLKEALLGIAAVALNPMLVGSGTNMKMLDYLAAGVPVVSTPVGVRGLDLDHERDLRVVGSADFAEAVRATLSDSDELADARAREMRREIEQRFDWRAVCAPLLREIEPRDPLGDRVARQRSAISA
jgi:glycosyltransferase involved in cell wall biosynthesis